MAPVIRRPQLPPETRKLVRPGRAPAHPTPTGPAEERVALTPSPEGLLIEELRTRLAALGEENSQLQQQVLAAKEQAAREGYAQGLAKGTADGQSAFEDRLAQVDALLETLQAQFGQAIAGLEDMAVGIAHAACCRVLGDLVATPEGVRSVVRQVIAEVRQQDRLVIGLAPADYELLEASGRLALTAGRAGSVEVLANASVDLGGCLVDTSYGRLDGRLEVQLQQLRDTLLATRAQRTQEG